MRKSKCVWSILYRVSCVSLWGVQSVDTRFENFGVTRAQRRAPPRRGTLLLSPVCAVVPPLGDARRPRRGEHHAASLRRVAGAYVFMSSGLTETLLSVTETGTSKVSVVCLVSVKQSIHPITTSPPPLIAADGCTCTVGGGLVVIGVHLFSFSPFTLHVSLEGLSATRYLSLSCRHPFFRSGRWASEASKARSAA